jgi:hypothetical protein
MLLSAVPVLVVALPSLKILEGLMHYPVCLYILYLGYELKLLQFPISKLNS